MNEVDRQNVSSREIARRIGKHHNNVLKSIDRLLAKGLDGAVEGRYRGCDECGGRWFREFMVDKDGAVYNAILGQRPVNGFYRVRENAALAAIEQVLGVNLERQYPACGKYRIDGYDPVNNIAYEIDEEQHCTPNSIDSDRIREEEIKAELGCRFVRIKV
ncbi:hypothetical protein L1G94_001383 [Escherichia coli]|nr:hypothetical protein [Escherichia coli]